MSLTLFFKQTVSLARIFRYEVDTNQFDSSEHSLLVLHVLVKQDPSTANAFKVQKHCEEQLSPFKESHGNLTIRNRMQDM
ncbi:hypothetical protein PanWU01x14_322310 [Parasponia andersonii]|uniref:Uncharacterized protein n=1 Tax=Parasponia andersonii TaxID=3476 RepID=A0A2P5AKV5_PARAD|nr:hypothetical protein PanWU01x14_322310 [Parasponia andersonii]